MSNYIYDSYIDRFEGLNDTSSLVNYDSPVAQSFLAFLSRDIKIKSYRFKARDYQKFIKKFSERRSVSVWKDEDAYIVFYLENTIIQDIYNAYNSYPFPYQILFLKYLKSINHTASTNIFLERIEDKAVRMTIITEKKDIATDITNIQSFKNQIDEMINSLNKKGFAKINFFVLDKTLIGFLEAEREATLISYSDIFAMFEDLDPYIFREPKENIKKRVKEKNLKDTLLISVSVLMLVFSLVAFKSISDKLHSFSSKIKAARTKNDILSNKLKTLSSERFLYVLAKQPQYSNALINIFSKFPMNMEIKYIKVTNAGGKYGITGIGYTTGGPAEFVNEFNELQNNLKGTGIEVASIINKAGKPYFYFQGHL
jgi:hypothetical protein